MSDLNPEILIREARDWVRQCDMGATTEEFIVALANALEAATKPRMESTLSARGGSNCPHTSGKSWPSKSSSSSPPPTQGARREL
jgi:hypothetical protein